MTELAIVDYFVMGEAVGIVLTFIATLYFSRRQMQKISTDIESKILNDLDNKMHHLTELAIARPELAEISNRDIASFSPKEGYAFYTLNVFAFAFHMHQRKILKDNEWNGWFRTIKKTFEEGTIGDYWKGSELGEWFDPEFQEFINNEVLSESNIKTENTRL